MVPPKFRAPGKPGEKVGSRYSSVRILPSHLAFSVSQNVLTTGTSETALYDTESAVQS